MVRQGDRYGLYKAVSTGGYGKRWCAPGRVYIGWYAEGKYGGVMIIGDGKIPIYMLENEIIKVGTVHVKKIHHEKR